MKYLIIIFAVVLVSCSATRQVIPLKKGENSVALSLGGPLFKFSGLVIPLPFTSAGWSRGVRDNLTITA